MTDFEAAAATISGRAVAVTGATGFIGRALVRRLVEAGADVTALLRSGHGAADLRRAGVRTVSAPLRPGRQLEEALRGVEVLFHFAYDVRATAEENLAAFDALLAAAERAGVRRIVHASSVVVYDDWPSGGADGRITEGSSQDRLPAAGYRQAKIVMERRLMAGTIPAAILQPTIVYGPGSELWTEGPMAALRAGGLILPDPCGRCPLVHVEDVARAAILAAVAPDLGRERFLISGPSAPGWEELFESYARLVGQGRVIRAPRAQLHAEVGEPGPASDPGLAARVGAGLRHLIGRKRFAALKAGMARFRANRAPLRPDPFTLSLYEASPVIDTGLAASRIGFLPGIDLQEGIGTIQEHHRRLGRI